MAPRDATIKAMEEVSGPVVSIALILASVFIPVAFMGGIQGSLNKQFAITIAISVLISAFNALTLSPALAAMWLRPRKQTRRAARQSSSAASTAAFDRGLARLRRRQPRVDPEGGRRRGDSRRVCRPRRRARPAPCRPASCPRRTTATSCSTCSCRRPRRCSEPTTCAGRSRRSCRKTDGLSGVQRDRRLQPADPRHGAEQRLLLRRPEAVERARRPGMDARAIVESPECTLPGRRFPKRRGWPSCRRRFPAWARRAASRSGCRIAAAARSSTSTRRCRHSSPRRGSGRSWPASPRRSAPRCRRSTSTSIATRC